MQGEYYLTDTIKILVKENKKVGVFQINNQEEVYGINTPEQLKRAEKIISEQTQNL